MKRRESDEEQLGESRELMDAEGFRKASLNQTRILHKRSSVEDSLISIQDQSRDSIDSKPSVERSAERLSKLSEKANQILWRILPPPNLQRIEKLPYEELTSITRELKRTEHETLGSQTSLFENKLLSSRIQSTAELPYTNQNFDAPNQQISSI